MDEKKIYKIRIEGNGLSLERNVSKDIAEHIIVSILTGEPQSPGSSNEEDPRQAVNQDTRPQKGGDDLSAAKPLPTLSIREFLDKSNARRIPDKIAAIGYYYETHDNRSVFSQDDLVRGFESAAEPVPRNISRDIKWAIRAAWIAPKVGQKGMYYVTHAGKQAVDSQFPGEILKKTRHVPSSTRKT